MRVEQFKPYQGRSGMILYRHSQRGRTSIIYVFLLVLVACGLYSFSLSLNRQPEPATVAAAAPGAAAKTSAFKETFRESLKELSAAQGIYQYALRGPRGLVAVGPIASLPERRGQFEISPPGALPYTVSFQLERGEDAEGRRNFQATFTAESEGAPQSGETLAFSRENLGTWQPALARPEAYEFTIFTPDAAMVENLVLAPPQDAPFVFVAFNQPGTLLEQNYTWVAGVAENSRGTFELFDCQLHYRISQGSKPNIVRVDLTFAGKSPLRVAPEPRTLEITPKQLGTWIELGAQPEENFTCMLLSRAQFTEMRRERQYPAVNATYRSAAEACRQHLKGIASYLGEHVSEVNNLLAMAHITQPLGPEKGYVGGYLLLEGQRARVGGAGESWLGPWRWQVKLRPRLLPRYYPGLELPLPPQEKMVDCFYTVNGQAYGNFLGEFTLAEKEGRPPQPERIARPAAPALLGQ